MILASLVSQTLAFGLSGEEILSVLLLQRGYNTTLVIVGVTLLGVASGLVGSFALLRERSLMGDALAHSALPGLCGAFLLSFAITGHGRQLGWLLAGATVSGCCGVLCVQAITRYSRVREDAAIGMVLSCFFGFGVVLLSAIQTMGTGEEGGLHSFIFGQTAAMNRRDVTLTLVTAMWVIAVSAALLKEFRLVSFDRAFAASQGWPISLIDIVLMSLVVMITIIGLQSVGLLLVVAFLIIPAAAARLWTDSFTTMVFLGGICGGLSGYGGAVASAIFPQLPTGAVIVLVATAIFFISLLIAPRRGILARILAHTRVTLRIVSDHFLREMYEACEDAWRQRLAETPWREVGLLAHQTGVSGWYGVSLTLLLYLRGDLELRLRAGSLAVRLSASGLERARHKVRNHRLWEQYLLSRTEVHLTHVDFSADVVEHFLSSEVISRLEEALQRRTTPSLEETVPQCPHSGGEV